MDVFSLVGNHIYRNIKFEMKFQTEICELCSKCRENHVHLLFLYTILFYCIIGLKLLENYHLNKKQLIICEGFRKN